MTDSAESEESGNKLPLDPDAFDTTDFNTSEFDINSFDEWIGRREQQGDTISARPVQLMQALLERQPISQTGDKLPPLWHWFYFPTLSPLSALGRDGHPKLGGFMPPVPLPRRMWAGGRFQFFNPVLIGSELDKISTIKSIKFKNGRTGRLCFVTVKHEFFSGSKLAIAEEHDIVYRDDPKPGVLPPPPPKAPPSNIEVTNIEGTGIKGKAWQQTITPSPLMLFRYSALTYNGHRIHYDRDYCQRVEGYEGLVFHGPLTATLLIDMVLSENKGEWVSGFEFRAISPLFDTASFEIAGLRNGAVANVWAANEHGDLSMTAKAEFS